MPQSNDLLNAAVLMAGQTDFTCGCLVTGKHIVMDPRTRAWEGVCEGGRYIC